MKKIFLLLLVIILAIAVAGYDRVSKSGGEKRIGVLQFLTHPSIDSIVQGVIDGMNTHGVNESNALIDLQNANGDNAVANTIATKFAADECDLIIAVTTGAAQAAYNATRGTDIPVVFVAVSDPLGAGVVDNMAAPTTGVTGISDLLDVATELQLVKTLLPEADTIGVVYNAGEVNSANEVKIVLETAPKMGLKVETMTISSTADVPLAMDAILARGVDVIVNTLDNTLVSALDVEIAKADERNVPIIGSTSEQVKDGALASNGFDQYDVGVAAAPMIKKVLDGTPTSEIPVENCTLTTMYINKTAAEKYGVPLVDGAEIVE